MHADKPHPWLFLETAVDAQVQAQGMQAGGFSTAAQFK
jgi:hypothetical protein